MARDNTPMRYAKMKTCPVCGREFWCYDTERWAYRERSAGGAPKGYICSWHCQVKHNEKLGAPKIKREYYKRDASGEYPPEKVMIYRYLPGLDGEMKKSGFRLREMEELTDIPMAAIESYRKMRSRCREERIAILADVLGCTVAELTAPKNGEGTPS